jgi:hypothetical protein
VPGQPENEHTTRPFIAAVYLEGELLISLEVEWICVADLLICWIFHNFQSIKFLLNSKAVKCWNNLVDWY